MATTKTEAFAKADVELAALAKALAHPARLAILRALASMQTCICGDLVEVLPLAQATVSQHLKVLKEAGLIIGEVEGPRVCYCLDVRALRRARAAFEAFFEALSLPEDVC
ncbi:MAG: hypothetical protein KatS3mg044_0267 [Rhodothermaceae bacterium]|nr:MAG: hypothetical protein KatS3mg044_0267 [Rhodothermaceae bacterium]